MKRRRIGLFGGSFDPAHRGHVALTLQALRRFRLDQVWWLVSPGNPLKQNGPAPLADRMAAARGVMDHPRVKVTDIEARIGTRYTAQTLRYLVARHSDVQFVWLMGADNLIQFDQWKDWDWIMNTVPIGILARPGSRLAPLMAMSARRYSQARIDASDAGVLAMGPAPRWCYVNMPLQAISSTKLRQGS